MGLLSSIGGDEILKRFLIADNLDDAGQKRHMVFAKEFWQNLFAIGGRQLLDHCGGVCS